MGYKLLLILILLTSAIYSQRMTERMVIFNPLQNANNHAGDNEISWVNTISGWAEFGGYLYDSDDSHAWYQKLGAFAEIFRISDRKSLAVLSNIEFIADPHNDINFNPRAIFWEEALLYSFRAGKDFWQIGYYHRCKHDIDNLDIGYERSLIYGSIQGRYHRPINLLDNTEALLTVRGDVYTILQDYRKPVPAGSSAPYTDNLAFSTALNFNLRHNTTGSYGLFFASFLQMNFYSNRVGYFSKFGGIDNTGVSGGAETGLFVQGKGRIKIAMRYEFFEDSGFNIVPQQAHLASLGISFYPIDMF